MDGDKKNEPTGRAKGGIARRDKLTPERRTEIARKAAEAKHAAIASTRPPKPITATHRGNFKEEFGFDVDCYVLDDARKTAAISQRGMGRALGLESNNRQSGQRLQRFIRGGIIAQYLGAELTEKLENPLVFQGPPPGPNTPPFKVHGYDVTILIDICKAIAEAERDGKLLERQADIAKQARIIVNASAKAGITNLVYALSGYDVTKEQTIAAFKLFVREEAREYEKEFPDELYSEWYRLYELPRPEKNKPWKFMHLTIQHVYYPLARSQGRILELAKYQRAQGADRRTKLHQFLSETGVKALRTHLGRLLGMAETSNTSAEYERHVEKKFGTQQGFDFADPA